MLHVMKGGRPVVDAILIVDDESDVAESCARILKRAGFSCLVANDVPMALWFFDLHQPELVLSDIDLGSGNGFEIALYVGQKAPATPVILMTSSSYVGMDALKVASRAGAAGYLRKPFSNSELIATVRFLLSTKRGDHSGLGG